MENSTKLSLGNRFPSPVLQPFRYWNFSLLNWFALYTRLALYTDLPGLKNSPRSKTIVTNEHGIEASSLDDLTGYVYIWLPKLPLCYYTCSRHRERERESINLYFAWWGDLQLRPAVRCKTDLNQYLTQLLNWNSISFEEEVGSTT